MTDMTIFNSFRMSNITAGRLNHLVDLLYNEIHQQEDLLENTTTPLNIGKIKNLHQKLGALISERENLDIHDYFDNEDLSINHETVENH